MIFESSDGAFGGVAAMTAGGSQLKIDIDRVQKSFEDFRYLIVQALVLRLKAAREVKMR